MRFAPPVDGDDDPMSNPQQPEIHRSGYGETTQKGQGLRATERDDPATGGNAAPTPAANETEDTRRSGTKSTVRRAVED